MTIDEYKSLCAEQKPSRRNKYGAKKFGGYDSQKEYKRATELKFMQHVGLISDLREQVRYQLIAPHRFDDGTIEHACYYIADFVYVDNETGQTVVEDTKGVRTKEYIIKRKLMLAVHGIRIKET